MSKTQAPAVEKVSFDEFWAKEWTPTAQPAVFDLAMRELSEKAWRAGQAACDQKLLAALKAFRGSVGSVFNTQSSEGTGSYLAAMDAIKEAQAL